MCHIAAIWHESQKCAKQALTPVHRFHSSPRCINSIIDKLVSARIFIGEKTSITFQAVVDMYVTTDASACSGPSRNSGRLKMPLSGSNLSTELDGGAAELRRKQYQKRAEEAAKAMTEIKKKFPKTQLIKHEASKTFSQSVQEVTVVKEGKTVQILKGFDLDIRLKRPWLNVKFRFSGKIRYDGGFYAGELKKDNVSSGHIPHGEGFLSIRNPYAYLCLEKRSL